MNVDVMESHKLLYLSYQSTAMHNIAKVVSNTRYCN